VLNLRGELNFHTSGEKMKKLIMSFTALSLFIFSAQSIAPRNANAVLLIELAADNHPVLDLPEVVLCIVTLPICLLGEKSAPPTAYTQQDLIDNGYAPAQVSAIEADQTSIMSNLQTRNLSMVIEKTDTYNTVATTLRSIDPTVSNDYINFVADINHIAIPQN
jgi:hypothetical protein